jgi:hypothetical protein
MPLTTIPFNSNNPKLPVFVTVASEMLAYSQAILIATGTDIDSSIPSGDLTAISAFLTAIKYATVGGVPTNLLAKLLFCAPLAGTLFNAAKVPLVGSFTTTYVSGDYTRTGGLVGGGAKVITTAIPANTPNMGLLLFTRNAAPSSPVWDFWNTGGVYGFRCNTAAISYAYGVQSTTTPSGAGMWGLNISGGMQTFIRNGASINSGSVTGAAPSTGIMTLAATVNTYGGGLITQNCTNAEFLVVANAFQTLMTAFGR